MANKLPKGLYALIDDALRADLPVLDKARAAIEGGAKVLQLRLKTTPDRVAVAHIRAVVALARPRDCVVIVNDRADLALISGAGGVHLGADNLPPREARALLGPEAFIGATCRTLSDIVAAQRDGADHVGLGPIFATSTKSVDAPVLGLSRFEAIVRASPLPVVGIAGVTLATIGQVAKAGAHNAAVASDLLVEPDVVSRVGALQRAFFAP